MVILHPVFYNIGLTANQASMHANISDVHYQWVQVFMQHM